MLGKKLVYEATRVAVKPNDVVQSTTLGQVTVTNVRAARKKMGHGRVTLLLANGTKGDYSPGIINAIWI